MHDYRYIRNFRLSENDSVHIVSNNWESTVLFFVVFITIFYLLIQEQLFAATKRFVIIRDLKIQMAECNETSQYEDNVMKVQYVPLTRSAISYIEDDDMEEQDSDDSSKEVQVGSNGMLVSFLKT